MNGIIKHNKNRNINAFQCCQDSKLFTLDFTVSIYTQFVLPSFCYRDFSSGYLVAEIFSRYYPQDFSVHSYDKGTSLSAKQRNWSQIERVRETPKRYNAWRKTSNPRVVLCSSYCVYCSDIMILSLPTGTLVLSQSLQRQNLHLMKEVIDGAIHCKPGAAELLVQEVYTVLTNRR